MKSSNNIENNKYSIAIACPGRRRTLQQASELYSKGWLTKWITSSYLFGKVLSRKSPLKGLDSGNIPSKYVRSIIFSELLFKSTSSFTFLKRFRSDLWEYRNSIFAKKALSTLEKSGHCDLYYGYSSGCGETSRFLVEMKSSQKTMVAIEQASAPQYFEKMRLSQELQKWPHAGQVSALEMPKFLEIDEEIEHKNADAIIVACDFIRNILVNKGIDEQKIHILQKGIDTQFFTPDSLSEYTVNSPLNIIYAGNISLLKGVPYLLEAVKKIGSKYVHLNIVGKNQLSQKFIKQYEDVATFHGHVDKYRLRELYRANDIYIHPSLSESNAYVVSEAMACGLPAIATYESGSFVRNGVDGFEIPSANIEAIISAISFFIENPKKINDFGINAHSNAKSFDIRDYGKRYSSTIDQILSKNQFKRQLV